MKVRLDKKVVSAVLVTTVLLTAIFINGSADGTTPGSEADPIVTQSYVEQKSEQTKYYIDSLIAKNNQEIANLKTQIASLEQKVNQMPAGGSGAALETVLVAKGKTLLTSAGTEVILRSGTATAIKGANGGLSDVTKGADLGNGEAVVKNHLLISARDDGRGISVTQDAYVMVRGAYTIK